MQSRDQRHHEDREHAQSCPVHRTRPPASPGTPPQHQRRGDQHDDVEPEIGAPSRIVGHDSADQRSNAEAEHQEAGPGTDRLRPLCIGGRLRHRRKGARYGERSAKPLQARAPMTTIPAGATAISNEARATPRCRPSRNIGRRTDPPLAAENDEYRGSGGALTRLTCAAPRRKRSSSPAEPP